MTPDALNDGSADATACKEVLQSLLALLRAQSWDYQTSHWQTKGAHFYGNHLLFERLYGNIQKEIDELAEKLVGYFGKGAADSTSQFQKASEWLTVWSSLPCRRRRGLKSEIEFQKYIKGVYDLLSDRATITLGLDDWLMATANAHESHMYLLQQALGDNPSETYTNNVKLGRYLSTLWRGCREEREFFETMPEDIDQTFFREENHG